jgi:DNA-binding FadR family transcriptional regulator
METHVQHGNITGMILADARFHHIITRASGNTYLISLMDNIVQVLEEVRKAALHVPGLGERALAGHQQLYAAIARGDRAAASASMTTHLQDAWWYIDHELDAAIQSGT